MKLKTHAIVVVLKTGERITYYVRALTRQDAKWFMYNRIFKWACYGKRFVGASVSKFNPQNYLARVSA